MKKFVFVTCIFWILLSCEKQITPIHYGEESCEYCRMTIVDQGHAAQIVTHKGKNYKFDSSECMINFLEEHEAEEDMEHILSADYANPGMLVDVSEATFLISEGIPSPMGAFLSATEKVEDAENLQKEFSGRLFNWDEIKEEIRKQEKHHVTP